MIFEEYCETLDEQKLAAIAISLCEVALFNWDHYTKNNKLRYKDTIAALYHEVRPQLLADTLAEVKNIYSNAGQSQTQINKLLNEFTDPLVAIDDNDWSLPNKVQKSFQSIYHLACGVEVKRVVFGELTHYLAINQAIEAIEEGNLLSETEIRALIYTP